MKQMMNTGINEPVYALSDEIVQAIKNLNQKLDLRQRIDTAIQAVQIENAKAEYDQAMQEQAEAESTLVLADTREHAIDAEKIAASASKKVEKKLQILDREKRLLETLCNKAVQADEEIKAARSELTTEATIFSQTVNEVFSEQLTGVIALLTPLLKQAYALQSVLRFGSMGRFLAEIKIPDVFDQSGRYDLIDGALAKIGNQYVSLSGAWQSDSAAKAISDAFSPLKEAIAKGDAHKQFIHPDRRPKPYVIKGYSTTGIDKSASGMRAV
jgi:hypothetical protein